MIGRWTPESFSIDASAGYGKTEKLCTRLLAHFLSDRDATRNTVAMTFTKPAAGEIYSRMLQMLSSALQDDKKFGKLREAFPPELAQVSREELHELLVRLIDDMDKLNISTIDSFFYRLVRVFAIELGLPGRVELDETGGESPLTESLLRELFGSSAASENLLDACRESRIGNEKKTFFDSCLGLLKLVQSFRNRLDSNDFWGGKFMTYKPRPQAELDRALAACDAQKWPDKYATDVRPLLAHCAEARDPKTFRFSGDERKLLRGFLKVLPVFPARGPENYHSGWDYAPVEKEIRMLIENGRDILLYQCATRTAGLRTLLAEYEELYDRMMLRRGRITFADLPLLLAESAAADAKDERMAFLYEMQYRTNSRFRHFLIDEFQDTSRLQWKVLAPLVADNGEKDHSLSIVGDVKQAIYGWREGDSKLMAEVTETLGLKPDPKPLKKSYRYGPEICDALNYLFPRIAGTIAALKSSGAPAAAKFDELLKRWDAVFQPHATARKKRHGEFEVLALAPEFLCNTLPHSRPKEDFTVSAAKLILERLERIDFFSAANGVTAAVLVRSNKDGIALREALVKMLRAEYADRVVWEGSENIVNNPLAATLIAFGIALQHPADTFARETAAMNLLLRELMPANEEERLEWLTLLDEFGIAGFLRRLLLKLNERARSMRLGGADPAWSPVENGDVDDLLSFADSIDRAGGSRDFIRFRDLAVAKRKKAPAVAGKLQIMTIHHSKGLSFDLVFHPMFDPTNGNWNAPATDVAVTGGGTPAAPAWLLNAPSEEGMSMPDIADAVLSQHADSCFEELCSLYVALTRARRGVYVFLPPRTQTKNGKFHCDWKPWTKDRKTGEYKPPAQPRPRSAPYIAAIDSCYIADLVFDAVFTDPAFFPDVPGEITARTKPDCGLPCLRRAFGATWHPAPDDEAEEKPHRRMVVSFRSSGRKLYRSTPSKLAEEPKLYFDLPKSDGGALLGTEIHKFFESIERLDENFVPPAGTSEAILEHYRVCRERGELEKLLNEDYKELWRERPFDVLVEDGDGVKRLISGCFDRVQIYRDDRGGITRACIIDYKSNRIEGTDVTPEVERYREQLESYRTALAKLLGISPNIIRCRLVFTQVGVVAPVNDPAGQA